MEIKHKQQNLSVVSLSQQEIPIITEDVKTRYAWVPVGIIDIDDYFQKEVKPHLPNSWVDKEKTQVGYEINFTKYFYQYTPLRSVQDVLNDLLNLEKESDGLMNDLIK